MSSRKAIPFRLLIIISLMLISLGQSAAVAASPQIGSNPSGASILAAETWSPSLPEPQSIEQACDYQPIVLADNPIAYWRLGETTGTTASNIGILGAVVDGTYQNSVTLGSPGLVVDDPNTAASFDGTDDYVSIPSHDEINLLGPFAVRTIELWFKANAFGGKQILYEQGGVHNGFNIFLDESQLYVGAWENDAGNWVSTPVALDTAYHVALVFDGSGGPSVTGYLDGASFDSTATAFSSIPGHVGLIGIGGINDETLYPDGGVAVATGDQFNGVIDEVAMYNAVLSPERILAHAEGCSASGLVCESFDTGYTPGAVIGSHPDWYDGGGGPVVTDGIGVAGSVGLAAANNIFTWIAQPFDWNAPNFAGLTVQMDFQTDGSGQFDDDRVGWMITDDSTSSSNILGIQMDPGGGGAGGNIEGYWDGVTSADRRPSIVDLPALSADTWYRLQAEITKLTATSAGIDVTLTELNAAGDPVAVIVTGSIADTSTLGDDEPNAKYFTATSMWPAYKNYTAAAAPADNACHEVVTIVAPTCYALTLSHTGQGTDPVASLPNSDGCPAGEYVAGEVIGLSGAVPDSGWEIVGWTGTDDDGSTAETNAVTMPPSAHEASVNYGEITPSELLCESFEFGYTLGAVIGTHPDWYDGGSGPVLDSGIGLVSSIGLAPASAIFTWAAHPFDWNAPNFEAIRFQMDFQTNASGQFDDDRMGWMITDSDAGSTNFFGVQLDHTDGGIVTYWRDSSDARIQDPIVPLSALSPSTWYRFGAEITKLTDTSASIDVSLVELDASGDPTGAPYTGSVADTSAWPGGAPDTKYFTTATMWPAYKNYSAITGAADNTCFGLVSERFAFVVTTDLHTSDADPNLVVEDNLQQIRDWIDSPTPDMPPPEFMVITGDFPHLSQTEAAIDSVIGTDFLWYPVIGNHEISDDINNFYAIRDTKVPSLPYITNYGPTGSTNTSYAWDYGNAHFVAVNAYWDGTTDPGADTATDGNIVPALRTWIDDDLAASSQTHSFAFVHEPAYPSHRHVGDSLDQYPANRDAFIATLNTHDVESLFCGHTHYYEHDVAPEFPLGDLHQITNDYLRAYDHTSITYVLVEGSTTTYRVYRRTNSVDPFALYDEWTISSIPPVEPPAAPTDLSATAVSYAQVSLAWTDNADNEANFEIERSTDGSGGPFSLLTTVPANNEAYADTGLAAETEYCYRVRATNAEGNSDYTDVACATTPEQPPVVGVCEDFESGFTLGQMVGTHPDWFDGGNGPVVNSGIGLAGSVGLAAANNIFTWVGQPFDWTAPDFVGVNVWADFQTDGSGHFDDDRVGWMIADDTAGSDNIFGVQMDPGGSGASGYNVEAYWDGDTFGDDGGRTSIADLPVLPANSWYRLLAEITKLTATSASIDVTVTELDVAGNPGAVVATGSIPDTDLLPNTAGNEIPNPGYFTGPIWPAYKNYTTAGASADNTCYEVVTGGPPEQYDLTINIVGNGSVTLDPAGGTYDEGTEVTLEAIADTGWTFAGWSDDLSGVENPTTLVMDGDKTVTATFTQDCYELILSHTGQGADPAATPTNSAGCTAGFYHYGEDIDLTADPATGWEVAGWTGTDNNGSTAETNTLTMPASAHAASVNYEAICYELTLSHTGQGADPVAFPDRSDGCAAGFYHYQEYVELSGADPDLGWEINGWTGTDNDASTAALNTLTMPANAHSASVNYSPTCYQLTLSHTGQGADPVAAPINSVGCATGFYHYGEDIDLTADPDTGWEVAGWTGTDNNSSLAETNTLTMPADDHAASVNYEATCYELTLSHTGQGTDPVAAPTNSVGCAAGFYHYDEDIDLSGADPDTGWEISGWTGTDNDASTAVINTLTMPASTHAASVNYEAICYELTLSHTGQGADPVAAPINSVGCATGFYHYGEDIDLTADPDTGWEVTGWTGTDNNSSIAETNTLTMPADDHAANVDYGQSCYRLTLSHTGQGADPVATPTNSDGCALGYYHYDEDIALSGGDPAIGWEISGWTGTENDSSTADTNTLTMPADDHAVIVNYEAICYQLTLSHTGQGEDPVASPTNSDGCAAGLYHYEEDIDLTADPDLGWRVSSWTGTDNNSSTAETNTLTMPASAHAASVNYEAIPQYTLTVTKSGYGSIALDPTGGTYYAGTVVTLTPTADPGWSFVGWAGPDGSYVVDNGDGTWSLTMDGNKEVTARFVTRVYMPIIFKGATP